MPINNNRRYRHTLPSAPSTDLTANQLMDLNAQAHGDMTRFEELVTASRTSLRAATGKVPTDNNDNKGKPVTTADLNDREFAKVTQGKTLASLRGAHTAADLATPTTPVAGTVNYEFPVGDKDVPHYLRNTYDIKGNAQAEAFRWEGKKWTPIEPQDLPPGTIAVLKTMGQQDLAQPRTQQSNSRPEITINLQHGDHRYKIITDANIRESSLLVAATHGQAPLQELPRLIEDNAKLMAEWAHYKPDEARALFDTNADYRKIIKDFGTQNPENPFVVELNKLGISGLSSQSPAPNANFPTIGFKPF